MAINDASSEAHPTTNGTTNDTNKASSPPSDAAPKTNGTAQTPTNANDEPSDASLFADLERESAEWNKDAEIDRIMHSFKLNAYAVLGILPGIPSSSIKALYRKKSLLIHPDKTTNPSAPDAFDRLQKAHTTLLDDKAREQLDEAIADARMLVMREQKWTVDSEELKGEEFLHKLWPEKAKQVLVDNELRRRRQAKGQMQEEGRQQRKDDEELAERKRKREEEEKWDKGREGRIDKWRDFKVPGLKNGGDGTGDKKKKKKLKVLG
ncbi:MAG: hypothetical protein M1828_004591 [Chrysothrix sp. TS-e1954]|nr:MAG: hypothetical protein M1828_004591 [Chrysothrix sp. TS-e1954]